MQIPFNPCTMGCPFRQSDTGQWRQRAAGARTIHQRRVRLCRPSVVQKWGSGVRRPGSVGPAIDPVRRTRAGTERELSGEQRERARAATEQPPPHQTV